LGRHPWSLTLRQFLDLVERETGGRLRTFFALGPRGTTQIEVFVGTDPATHFAVIYDLEPDEELAPSVLRSLCIQLGFPPDLVGLDPEEPYEPEDP
jgi:hypothetical protein